METATVTPPSAPGTWSRNVAGEIRAVMGRQGIRSADLARTLNVTPMWVTRRVSPSARIAMTLEDVELVAEGLGVEPISLLLPRLDSNQQPSGYRPTPAQARFELVA